MEPAQRHGATQHTDPSVPALDDVTAYQDDDALVICDTQNPSAWVRSESTVTLDP